MVKTITVWRLQGGDTSAASISSCFSEHMSVILLEATPVWDFQPFFCQSEKALFDDY